jgi:hypothetical protein
MLNNHEGEKLKQILAIDGKTIRGNGNKNQDPPHIVSAWSKKSGVCFGRKSADGKGKEVPMIKALLDIVPVRGRLMTIDAIGTRKEIAEKIRQGKGDYALAAKDNQQPKNLLAQGRQAAGYVVPVRYLTQCTYP